jgi:hypothetical protein
MSGLREALGRQREAMRSLAESQANAGAWVDDQRQSLDRSCLEPLSADGRRLYDALRRASREIIAAERMVAE